MKKITTIVLMFLALITSAQAISIELISSNPNPIMAGEYADLSLRFEVEELTGDTNFLEQVEVSLEDSQYFWQLEGMSSPIPEVYSREIITRTYRIYFDESLEEGYINLPFKISTLDQEYTKELQVYVQEAKEVAELRVGKIETFPKEISRDSHDNKLELTIQNLGEQEAQLIEAQLVPNSPLVKESFISSFKDSTSSLDEVEEDTLEFYFDLDEEFLDSELNFTLLLSYREENSQKTAYEVKEVSQDISVRLIEVPYLEVVGVSQEEAFIIGSPENIFKVKVKNTGGTQAEHIRVRLQPDISVPFIFEKLSQYGTYSLESGEEIEVTFKAEVLESALPQNYSFKVELESLQEEVRFSQDDQITIQVGEKQQADPQELTYAIIALIIVISAYLGVVLKRKSKKKKN